MDHYDSYSQTQQQTHLPEPTVTHHDKEDQSPTCTDIPTQLLNEHMDNSTLENSLVSTETAPIQSPKEDQSVSSLEQQQVDDQSLPTTATTAAATAATTTTTTTTVTTTAAAEAATTTTAVDTFNKPTTTMGHVKLTENMTNQENEQPSRHLDDDSLSSSCDDTIPDPSIVPTEQTNENQQQQEKQQRSESIEPELQQLHTNGSVDQVNTWNTSTLTPMIPSMTVDENNSEEDSQHTSPNINESIVNQINEEQHQQVSTDQSNHQDPTNVTSEDDNISNEDRTSHPSVDPIIANAASNDPNSPLSVTMEDPTAPLSIGNQYQLNDNATTLTTSEATPCIISPTSDTTSTHVHEADQNVIMHLSSDDGDIQRQQQQQENNAVPTVPLSISTNQTTHIPVEENASLHRTATTGSDELTLTEPPRPRHVWESDRQASECRRCNRRFNFLVRRHHCRRCGQVVCDRCSSHRVRLPVEELVEDPMISTSHYPVIALNPQRVCEACIRIPIKATDSTTRYTSSSHGYTSNHFFTSHQPSPMNMRRSDSQQSLMADCPVCGTGLLGMRKEQQENHLNECLNSGSPTYIH
ncbi:uncharacterized protein BX664DRAFT_48209 [Halteromyces radiatus]|uniref:uncharacterized protein n=1 Tax=Halteromyces radiatus TaxID=101107 RepID=UPI00221F2069|nr:uncharacterized protein BX664DRAFT_48209 [Halteromyces radiatus]KAI8076843.1 hypothetical protein BX664DRAFT_48209 [Halteromyces radiatus]